MSVVWLDQRRPFHLVHFDMFTTDLELEAI